MLRSRTSRVFSPLLAALLTVMIPTITTGQEQTPVAIDDSPTARLLVQRVLGPKATTPTTFVEMMPVGSSVEMKPLLAALAEVRTPPAA